MRPELWPHSLLQQDLRNCSSQSARYLNAASQQGGSYMPEPLSNASESHLRAEGFGQLANASLRRSIICLQGGSCSLWWPHCHD